MDVTLGYVGFTPMFEAAGFRRVVETDARSAHRPQILMRLDLGAAEGEERGKFREAGPLQPGVALRVPIGEENYA